MEPALENEWIRQNNLVYGGLIAAGGLLVQPFLAAPSLDLTAMIATVAFSVSIPLLAALWLVSQQEAFRRREARSSVVSITKVVAQGTAFVGVVAAFWHIAWICGVAILAGALVGVLVHSAAYVRLEYSGGATSQGTKGPRDRES
jgi:hypothetical protein